MPSALTLNLTPPPLIPFSDNFIYQKWKKRAKKQSDFDKKIEFRRHPPISLITRFSASGGSLFYLSPLFWLTCYPPKKPPKFYLHAIQPKNVPLGFSLIGKMFCRIMRWQLILNQFCNLWYNFTLNHKCSLIFLLKIEIYDDTVKHAEDISHLRTFISWTM